MPQARLKFGVAGVAPEVRAVEFAQEVELVAPGAGRDAGLCLLAGLVVLPLLQDVVNGRLRVAFHEAGDLRDWGRSSSRPAIVFRTPFKAEPMMSSPGDVVELARQLRKTLGDGPTLMVDVSYLFHDVPTAARVCRELEPLGVYLFETPFRVDSSVPYAELAARTSIPLALGNTASRAGSSSTR